MSWVTAAEHTVPTNVLLTCQCMYMTHTVPTNALLTCQCMYMTHTVPTNALLTCQFMCMTHTVPANALLTCQFMCMTHTVPTNALLTSFLLMLYSVHKLDHFWSRSAVHTSLPTADRRSGSQPAGREEKGQVGVHNVCVREYHLTWQRATAALKCSL